MKSVVWKFKVPIAPGTSTFGVPDGARILSAEQQGHDIALWYLVMDEDAPRSLRAITTVMTGEYFKVPGPFVATVQCHGFSHIDPFVIHIFEEEVE